MEKRTEKVLALVGARSGSKGVPHKNIRQLFGKPLMAWIIEAASRARLVDRVIVSTDSEEYAEVARRYGAEVPFLRPAEISGDSSTDLEYIVHALDWLEKNEGYRPTIVLRLVPTSPMQRSEDIDACIQKFFDHPDADSSLVIAESRQHPAKAMKIITDSDGRTRIVSYITGSGQDVTPLTRQRYERAYVRANVVASRIKTIRDMNSLTGDIILYHEIGQDRAFDIDSGFDFFLAEKCMERLHKGPTNGS